MNKSDAKSLKGKKKDNVRGKENKEKLSSVKKNLAQIGFLSALCSTSVFPASKANEAQQTIQAVFCLNVE